MVRRERRTAQRIKRVLADITPQHLEQLTKQARALTGDYEMVEVQGGASMEVIRARLSNLQQRHSTLRDKLTNAYPPHRDFDENMEVCIIMYASSNPRRHSRRTLSRRSHKHSWSRNGNVSSKRSEFLICMNSVDSSLLIILDLYFYQSSLQFQCPCTTWCSPITHLLLVK